MEIQNIRFSAQSAMNQIDEAVLEILRQSTDPLFPRTIKYRRFYNAR